jgi:hypothetical protein
MNTRALPLVAVVLLALAGIVVVGTDRPVTLTAQFAPVATPSTPYAPSVARTTESWFCPGVPASGDGTSGQIVIANPGAEPLGGRYTLFNPDAAPVTQPFEVEPFDRTTIEVTDLLSARFVSALVEIDAGTGVVEQRAVHPAGSAIAPCANSASDSWYFADGWTVGDSVQHLVITNPFPGRAIVDIGFVTEIGARAPTTFQGYVIPANGMRVIDLDEAGVQDESLLAIKIEVTSGRVVAGRSQHLVAGGRLGYTMTLGSPSLDDQWWFADGETAEGVTESFVVYNPTEDDVEADLVFLGLELGPDQVPPEPITLQVPRNSVVVLNADVADLPRGRHGTVVSTLTSDSIVVERVLTRPAGDSVATTVQLGSQSAFVATRWHVPIGFDLALEEALVVMNVSFSEGTISINALGPGGEQPLPGLEEIVLPPNGILAIDLGDPSVVGEHLVVQTNVPVVVERRPERSPDLRGRSSALGVPEF